MDKHFLVTTFQYLHNNAQIRVVNPPSPLTPLRPGRAGEFSSLVRWLPRLLLYISLDMYIVFPNHTLLVMSDAEEEDENAALKVAKPGRRKMSTMR